MANNNIEKQLRNIGTTGAGSKGDFYIGAIYRISGYHVKVPQLQL